MSRVGSGGGAGDLLRGRGGEAAAAVAAVGGTAGRRRHRRPKVALFCLLRFI